ncbi:uncharacterized protein LOC120359104, partial [Solenopsis invicta]|uniref:uncharacterized protein LOC120359104 n=1 Tax=Solenopsis invicta TaxID=13686 RepID=UPI00193CDC7A
TALPYQLYFNIYEEIVRIDTLQISLNRFLLLLVGLWPYQQSILARLQLILFLGILTSFITFQFTVFVTLKCTTDLIISVFSTALFYTYFAIQYISFSVNSKSIKYLLEQVQHIYNQLTDENEISILEKYGTYAKRYTIFFPLLL